MRDNITANPIGILSGRYQPGHIGHYNAWKWMNQHVGTTYVATSDKVDKRRSPFNFSQKKKMLIHAGIPSSKIIQVKHPYQAREIVDTLSSDTPVVFGVSQKDMTQHARFQFKPKKDGSPAYLRPYETHKSALEARNQHAYVVTIPTFAFKVSGQSITSATQLRDLFTSLSHSKQAELIKDLYGSYDPTIHEFMSNGIIK